MVLLKRVTSVEGGRGQLREGTLYANRVTACAMFTVSSPFSVHSNVSGAEEAYHLERDPSGEIPGYTSPQRMGSIEEQEPETESHLTGSDSPYVDLQHGDMTGPQTGNKTVKKGIYVYRE